MHRVRYIATGGGMVMSLAFYNVLMRALSYKFSVAGRSVSTNATHTFWHCFHLPQSFTIQSQVHQTLLLESPFFSSSFSALPLASLSTTHTHTQAQARKRQKKAHSYNISVFVWFQATVIFLFRCCLVSTSPPLLLNTGYWVMRASRVRRRI